jgi:hypothetical protein
MWIQSGGRITHHILLSWFVLLNEDLDVVFFLKYNVINTEKNNNKTLGSN